MDRDVLYVAAQFIIASITLMSSEFVNKLCIDSKLFILSDSIAIFASENSLEIELFYFFSLSEFLAVIITLLLLPAKALVIPRPIAPVAPRIRMVFIINLI